MSANERSLRPNRSVSIVETSPSPSPPPTSASAPSSSLPPGRKLRVIVTLKDKMKIINDMDKGKRRVDIAREFGISASTASYIYQRKEAVIEQYERKFGVDEDERSVPLAQALLGWFERQIDANIPVSDPHMRRRAEELAAELGVNDFECSDRWLADFNATYNIVRDTRAPVPAAADGHRDWFHSHEGYEERDVYAAGGTALLYDADLTSYGHAYADNRISLLLATNVTGTHKYRPTIVGMHAQPAAFDGVASLPVCYTSSRDGLISRTVVEHFLARWDAELCAQDKRILLLLDDDPAYRDLPTSGRIKCVRADTSAMFRKVSSCLKYHYRRLQISRGVGREGGARTGLLEATRLLCLAWNCVTSQMIYDTFHPPVYGCLYFDTRSEERALSEENDEGSLKTWARVHDVPLAPELYERLDDLLTCDAGLPHLADTDCSAPPPARPGGGAETDATPKPSALEAFDAMKRLGRYLQSMSAPIATLDAASALENHIEYGVLMEIYKAYKSNADAEV